MILTAWRTSSGEASCASLKSIRISSRSRRVVSSSSISAAWAPGRAGSSVHLPQLGVARLGFLLLPVLAEGGTAPERLGDEGLGDAAGYPQRFKPVVKEQISHPVFVQNLRISKKRDCTLENLIKLGYTAKRIRKKRDTASRFFSILRHCAALVKSFVLIM